MGTCVHQIGYFFIILFTFVLMELCNCSGRNNMGVCKEREMQALLCFKKEFEDPMNLLSSWVDGVDCCTKWEGVVCNNVTGHVVQLRLTNPKYGFEFDHLPKGTLSPCLLELKQLSHLDLSGLYRYFSGSRIPNFIGSFANLKYLDLSNLGFQGIIPHQLGNLTSLHTLILQRNFDVKSGASLDWLSNLSNLKSLDLSYVNLSMAHNWLDAINMLPSLRELHLISCHLPKLSHSLRLLNNSLLEVLDLSYNNFSTVFPKWMFNLHNLVSLDVTFCNFLSPLPDGPWNLTSLNILEISGNNLNGSVPHQLFGLSHLISLSIGSNQLQDPLPKGFSNLTFLKNLDASGNPMNSRIPNWIFDWTNLESLYLYGNMLTGEIPKQLGNLSKLQKLYLSENMLTGEIPKQIENLSKLQELFLYENNLTGEIPKQIGNLSKLQDLRLYRNMLTGEIPKQIGNLSELQFLDLSKNMLTGEIPKQIGILSKLGGLYLERNRLCGSLPENLGYSFPMIEALSVSDNKLEGIVTENHYVNLTKLSVLYASGNRLTMSVNPNWTPPFKLDWLDLMVGIWVLNFLFGCNLNITFLTWTYLTLEYKVRFQHGYGTFLLKFN